MKNLDEIKQSSSRNLGHKVLSAIQILVIFVMTVVGSFRPAQVAAAAGPAPHTPGPHIMPFNPPGTGPRIRTQSAPSGAHLTYYGGPVISNMQSIDVSYGPGTYISSGTPATWIPSFTQQYLGSGVMDWLDEYNTAVPRQSIGRGLYAGTITITPSSSNNGSTIQDSQIMAELNAQITAGALPEPTSNTSYALFFRQGQTICQQGSCSLVAGGFCAYHSTFTAPNGVVATYQVMPDLAGSFGCGSSTDLNNTTSVLSHELIETLTDPQVGFATTVAPPLGWYDLTNGEIGDICNAQQGSFVGTDGNTYTLQQMFSNIAKNCITTKAPVPNDFSISASPASLNIAQGAADVSTISTAVTSGVAASVSLSLSGAPAGVTASLSPASVTSGSSATLSVAVDVSTVPGSYTLTVSGTEGAFTHSATVSLTVPAPVVNDFSISASPASLNIALGASDVSTISTAVTSGAAASVSLSVSGAPAGVTASLTPASVTSGGSATLSVAVDVSTVPGSYTLTVSGTEGAFTHSTTVSLTVPVPVVNDFSISASPASLNIAQGASDVSTINTAVTSGSAASVSLSVSGAPAGVTASLNPASVTAGASSTLSVVVDISTVPGSYTLTVSGTEGAFTHSTTVSLTVPVPVVNDFSISASPASINVAQGAAGSATISTAVTSGAAGTVSLSVSGAPAGVTASLSPASVTAGGSSTLSVSVGAATIPGSYTLTVSGTEGANTHSATVSLTVPVPVVNDFSISASPASINVAQGAAGSTTISTAVTSGAAGTVSLSVSGAPAGVTVSLSPASVTAGGSSTLSVSVGAATIPGSYTLTVSGTEGAITHSATLALTVTASVVPFPSTAVLDNFNRANGGVGSNWTGNTSTASYRINNNLLKVLSGGLLSWKPTIFGVNQEAFVTLSTLDNRSKLQGLMLKVQSGNNTPGAIVVAYDKTSGKVKVSTWRLDGTILMQYPDTVAVFANGDQLGAQTLASGKVKVYQNGRLIATITLNATDQNFFNSKGGRIGLAALFGSSTAAYDNFGGGNITP